MHNLTRLLLGLLILHMLHSPSLYPPCAGSTGRQRAKIRFEGEESPALTPSWLSASWNRRPDPGAGPPGVALEGEGSPKLPGGQTRGEDDADLAAVEEQVEHARCCDLCRVPCV